MKYDIKRHISQSFMFQSFMHQINGGTDSSGCKYEYPYKKCLNATKKAPLSLAFIKAFSTLAVEVIKHNNDDLKLIFHFVLSSSASGNPKREKLNQSHIADL